MHHPHVAQPQRAPRPHQYERHGLLLHRRGGRQHEAMAAAVKGDDGRGVPLALHAVGQQPALWAEKQVSLGLIGVCCG